MSLPRSAYSALVITSAVLCGVCALGSIAGCMGAGDDASIPVPVEGGHVVDAGDGAAREAESGPGEAASEGASDAISILDAADASEAMQGPPSAGLSSSIVDFGAVNCGSTAAQQTLTVQNSGGSPLVVSAALVGSAFSISSPSSLTVAPGGSGAFNLSVVVPATATAGVAMNGSLAIFTNDPTAANRILLVTAMPTGATLTGTSQYSFASTEVGVPASPVPVELRNSGNAPAVFTISSPSDPSIHLTNLPDGGSITLAPGNNWQSTGTFTPGNQQPVNASSTILVTGVTCGSSLSTVSFSAQAATGVVSGWPDNGTIDFGPATCGGAAPPSQSITLTNSGTTDARITSVATRNIGNFTTDATHGSVILANGGTLTIHLTAPAVPSPSPLTPISGTVSIGTDAEQNVHVLTLTEEPQGAVLAFDTSPTQHFGSFGTVVLLQSQSQSFNVTNAGNAPADVIVLASEYGVDGGTGSADAAVDATVGTRIPSAFTPTLTSFSLPAAASAASPSAQGESVVFQPVHANSTVGNLWLSVNSSTALCSALPAALPLSGNAIGGGPSITPTELDFGATCGGGAPGAQSFVVTNSGTVDMNWTLGSVTGPGASAYTISASPVPGLLTPSASSTVTVTAARVASPAPSPQPTGLTAQVAIDTDVPFDPPHIVTLREIPLGDQLSLSAGSLRYGQFPIATSIGQTFTVTNNANPGSPSASLSLVLGGTGAAAYSVSPSTPTVAPAGGASRETLTFAPRQATPYPATVTLSTGNDAVCTPVPAPLVVTGTGTSGSVSLSATTLAFGMDGNDPKGLVNCGATGLPHSLTISNVGNQSFHVTGLTLGKASASPFALSGAAASIPLSLGIGGSTSLTITPSIIPNYVSNPNDASAYSDTLTITTDVTGDSPHVVPLVMQPRGAVIVDTPLPTNWTFGTVGAGAIGTFTTVIQNIGNGPATVELSGLMVPNIFGLENNPTTVPPNSAAALVGQFTPPSANGTWTDRGQLTVRAPQSFCALLPGTWITPWVNLSGSSNSNPVATTSGSLAFPTSDCSSAAPGGQSLTLTNDTNQAYSYTVSLSSGTWYTVHDGGSGHLPASGSATILVNPRTVTPGPGVLAGSAPYADNLVVTLGTPTPTVFTAPVSWTLNGAVLSLPQGGGPSVDAQGQAYYVADTTSGFTLPMDNAGTAAASVSFSVQPSNAFGLQPTPPISVIPNIRALPEFVSASSSASCPSTTSGTATFLYSGPVCQPFAVSSVKVHSCSGSLQ